MTKEEILSVIKYSYNDYLLNDTPIPVFLLRKSCAKGTTIALLRYAVEEFLDWTPYEMKDHLNREVLEKLKLYDLCVKNLSDEFSVEFDPEKDFFFYAQICYPNVIRFDKEKSVIKHYEDLLSGKVKKFKKNFHKDINRVQICLRYLLSNIGFKSVKEMYSVFATNEGSRIIAQYGLTIPKRYNYDNNLDFLHDSLSEEDQNIDYYNYYKLTSVKDFKNVCKKFEKYKKKVNKKKALG